MPDVVGVELESIRLGVFAEDDLRARVEKALPTVAHDRGSSLPEPAATPAKRFPATRWGCWRRVLSHFCRSIWLDFPSERLKRSSFNDPLPSRRRAAAHHRAVGFEVMPGVSRRG